MSLPALAIGTPYTASVPSGTTIQIPVVLPGNAKYVWQNDPTQGTLTGIYSGSTIAGQYGKLRVCGANAWGCGMLPSGPYTVTLTQPPGAAPADISPTVLFRAWTFGDYFNFQFAIFGMVLWPNKYPST